MPNLLSNTATTSPLVKENVEDDLLDGRCCCCRQEDCRKASCRDSRRPGAGLVVLEGLRLESRSEGVIGVSDLRDIGGGAAAAAAGASSLFLLLLFFFFFELFRAASV